MCAQKTTTTFGRDGTWYIQRDEDDYIPCTCCSFGFTRKTNNHTLFNEGGNWIKVLYTESDGSESCKFFDSGPFYFKNVYNIMQILVNETDITNTWKQTMINF